MKVCGQPHATAAPPPPPPPPQCKILQDLDRSLGETESVWTLWHTEKSLAEPGIDRAPDVQTLARRYIDWAVSMLLGRRNKKDETLYWIKISQDRMQ
jgi:hypothetical protein